MDAMTGSHKTGLRLEDVRIALKGRELLRLDTRVEPGEVLTVMGPSGSGKSTFLAWAGGFLDPVFTASGRMVADGVDLSLLPPEERHAGLLFQDPLLFPHLSTGQNVAVALPQEIRGRHARMQLAAKALAEAGLEHFAERDPETLSGGQKARIALMRVLVSRPRLLLLDEPFSKLDMELRDTIRDLVFSKARAVGLPVILVTHDEADAKAAGGEVFRLV